MKSMSKMLPGVIALAAATVLSLTAADVRAQDKTITLCWAAWDPANALVELSKDFTAKSGVNMKFEFVPWPNFADRMLNELNSKGKLCDLIIGDSQWIGGAAESGHYVKLNDFFAKEGIKMSDFMPAAVTGYSEWPKGTPNYWALPAMGDALGWTYRKDWFAKPELQAEFKKKYGHDLAAPTTMEELKQIAEFFQGREVDGKKVYGAAIFTERGSEGITMGVSNFLYTAGFEYSDPKKPYSMEGFVNSADAVKGLEDYKLGAQLGTTSYQYIVSKIKPSKQPSVFPKNDAAVQALKNKQIDGLVVDLPTAFFVTAAQVENSRILGQFQSTTKEHFGMVLEKGNSLTQCINSALAQLRTDGTLQDIQDQWLSKVAGAPVLH